MKKMNKEEIINEIKLEDKLKYSIEKAKKIMDRIKDYSGDCSEEESLAYDFQYVQGLLDLYNQEKEKNKKLEESRKRITEKNKRNFRELQDLRYEIKNRVHIAKVRNNYIHKDKIREKIKELENKEYILSSRYSEIRILQELLEEKE